MGSCTSFSFGRNWQYFLRLLDDDRVHRAEQSLIDWLGLPDLRGKTFLDIGSGSGLFSLAAFRLGADRVVSFDVDPYSVACTRYLYERAGKPPQWEVREASVLDTAFLAQLGQFDIVYSWGVLHHTGAMWQAVRNAAALVAPGGMYYIALYNRTTGLASSERWLRVKQFYNRAPGLGKRALEGAYATLFIMRLLARRQNPVHYIRTYRSERGMNWWTDVRDWLGGYPYEAATPSEVIAFMSHTFPHYTVARTQESDGNGCNMYLLIHRRAE